MEKEGYVYIIHSSVNRKVKEPNSTNLALTGNPKYCTTETVI